MITTMKEEADLQEAAARVKARAGAVMKMSMVPLHVAIVLHQAARAEAAPAIRAADSPVCPKKKCAV